MNRERCTNLNHRRPNAPVRGCPTCGEIVNARVHAAHCSEAEHAQRRKSGDTFCTACCGRLRK